MGTSLDERLYVQQDVNWNVTAVVDESGVVQERYVYTPFGEVTYLEPDWDELTDSGIVWVYGHQGGRFEILVGVYNFRNRDLSPSLGRWVTPDPTEFEGSQGNFYNYVNNAPINNTDSSGLRTVTIHYYYNTNIDITVAMQQEVNRIFQDCIKRKADPGATLIIEWRRFSPAEYKKLKFGWWDNNNFDVGFDDRLLYNAAGQTGSNDFTINPDFIRTDARRHRLDYELAIATTIAHESGLHVIGGKTSHYHDSGYVDATIGKVGGVFSDEACCLIVSALDLEPEPVTEVVGTNVYGGPVFQTRNGRWYHGLLDGLANWGAGGNP